jgi:hypothetical protein
MYVIYLAFGDRLDLVIVVSSVGYSIARFPSNRRGQGSSQLNES